MVFTTCKLTVGVGADVFRLRALSDRQQYSDDDGAAERAGISSAQWSLFGHLWPASRVLAEAMNGFTISGLRILEIGCGLGLPSLVLKKRGADITASDHHPLAAEFLEYNTALNRLDRITYRDLSWAIPEPDVGRFDLIIGSDVLYERDHGALLSRLVLRHALHSTEVVITDPGRGLSGPFIKAMLAQGFACSSFRSPVGKDDFRFRVRLLKFKRWPQLLAEPLS